MTLGPAPSTGVGGRGLGGLGLMVAALPAGLILAVGLRIGPGIEDAVIVLGVLIVALGRDTIARGQRITREPYVFLVNLMGVAADPAFGAIAVEIVMARRAAMLLAMRPPARSPSI